MSESERYRNKKKMWLITGVVVALSVVVCLIAIYFNRTSQPVMNEGSSSSQEPMEPSEPIEPDLPEESEPEEPMEPEEPESSDAPAPPVTSTPVANPAPTMVTISQAGTFSTASTYRQVVITSGGVILKNKTVTGNLFLMESVGDGNVELENVIVNGTLYIYGGGANTITLRNVSANQVLIQRDNGTVGVLATEECHLGEITVKCDAILTEENLTNGSAGFDVLYINEGLKNPYNITLRNVALQRLVANAATELSLSGGSYVGETTAQAPLHITGSGNMGTLWVYNNSVTYETAPGRVEVSGDYTQPTHGGSDKSSSSSTPKKDKDEGGSYTNPGRTQRLSMPRNLTISYRAQDDSFVASFSPVSRATGYTVTPYLKKDGLSVDQPSIRLDGENATTAVILKDAKNYLGQELRFRVFALGNPDNRIEESEEATTPFTPISQLTPPTGLAATFNKDENGTPRFDLQWDRVDGVRGYQVTITDQTATPPTTQQVFVEGKTTHAFTFDRTGGGTRHFTFTVKALAANDTVRIDSPDSGAVTGQVTLLPEPTGLSYAMEDGSLTLRWDYPGSVPPELTSNFLLTVAVDGTPEKTSYTPTAEKRVFAIGTLDALGGKTIRCTLQAVAGGGGGDSLPVALSVTLSADGTLTPLMQTAALRGGALGGGGFLMASPRTPFLYPVARTTEEEQKESETSQSTIPQGHLKTGVDAMNITLAAGANLPDGSLPAPANPVVVYLPATEDTPAGYYGQWGGVWSSSEYEVIPIIGGEAQPPVTTATGETQCLLLEKQDFLVGQAVTFTVTAKGEQGQSPAATCETPGIPKRLAAPTVELEVGKEGNFSVTFLLPAGNPRAVDYNIYPVLDGQTGEKAGSVRPGPESTRLTAPFGAAGNSAQWQIPYVRVKATSPDTDWLDSQLSAPNAHTWDLRTAMAYRQPEGQPAYCFFKLPKGYSGPYNFALLDVTDPTNPQVIYSTTTRGNPLTLVPNEEMSFGWCPQEFLVGKRARIVLTSATAGETFTFGTRDFIIQ